MIDIKNDLYVKGFVEIPFLNFEECNFLIDTFNRLSTKNSNEFYSTRKEINPDFKAKSNQIISELINGKIKKILPGYKPLFGSFLIKFPKAENQVGIHQDWTYVDES